MGVAQRRICIRLTPEELARHGPGKVGLLLRSMYGTQDASHIWQKDYVAFVCETGGFVRGKHNAALFRHDDGDIKLLVQADSDGLAHLDQLLRSKYTVKNQGALRFDPEDDAELHLLNRTLRRGEDALGQLIDLIPDGRHAELIIKETGCTDKTKSVSTPNIKEKDHVVLARVQASRLDAQGATSFRSCVMRASDLAQDRMGLCETAKGFAQRMKAPTFEDLVPLKWLARCLVGRPRARLRYRRQNMPKRGRVFVDSDYAADLITRKSTTGLVAMVGLHQLKCPSNLQSLIALSVGESEYYAITKGGVVAIDLSQLYQDLGLDYIFEVASDSSTARSLSGRLGVGQRTKHIQTRYDFG